MLVVLVVLTGAATAHAESSGGVAPSSGPSGGSTAWPAPTGPEPDASELRWTTQKATWYGPGFFGNETACGQKLTRRTVGVAHKTLPCGSRVVIRYEGRTLRTRVIDRGPYANGAKWDLTQAAARRLGFEFTDRIAVAKLEQPV